MDILDDMGVSTFSEKVRNAYATCGTNPFLFNNLFICYDWHIYCKLVSISNWHFCLMGMSRITQ